MKELFFWIFAKRGPQEYDCCRSTTQLVNKILFTAIVDIVDMYIIYK